MKLFHSFLPRGMLSKWDFLFNFAKLKVQKMSLAHFGDRTVTSSIFPMITDNYNLNKCNLHFEKGLFFVFL